MTQIKTPKLEIVIGMTDSYVKNDNKVIEDIREGRYTREQWMHYYYVNLTLNLSASQLGDEDTTEFHRRVKTLLPEAYKAAADIFGIPVEEVKRDWELIVS